MSFNPSLWPRRALLLSLVAGLSGAIYFGKLMYDARPAWPHSDGPPQHGTLQRVWRADEASRIIGAWRQENALEAVRTQTFLDFGFIPSYVVFGASALLLLARPLMVSRLTTLARGIVLAGMLDVLENLAMLKVLEGGNSTAFQPVVAVFAGAKWFIVLGTAFYLAAVLVRFFVLRSTGRRDAA